MTPFRAPTIPTVITDVNGKVTTVHKKDAASSKSNGVLAGMKPTIAAQPKKKNKLNLNEAISIDWWDTSWGSKGVDTTERSFFQRAGLSDKVREITKHEKSGKQSIQAWELYEFLRNGISPAEAAMMHRLGIGADQLQSNEQVRQALPGNLARIINKKRHDIIPIQNVVDLLREQGVNPKKAASIIGNGLSDTLYERSELEPKDMFTLFERFKYQHTINDAKPGVATITLDAVNEGKLPVTLLEKNRGIDRPTIKLALDVIYSDEPKYKNCMTDETREYLLSNPERLAEVASLVSHSRGKREEFFANAALAVEKYGFDACNGLDPELMLAKLPDGTDVGPEGARQAHEFLDYFDTAHNGSYEIRRDNRGKGLSGGLAPYRNYGVTPREIPYVDIVVMLRAGASNEKIRSLIHDMGLDTKQAIAVVTRQTLAAVADGWL